MDTLSAYIARALTTELPPEVIEKAKLHILDTIAAIISGSRLLPGIKAAEYARTQGGAPEALVLGSDLLTNVVTAALANGMAAHADETDDSHKASRSHPGCGVVPAALALAERNNIGGSALIKAVVLGYDVACRSTPALVTQALYDRGHATHSFAALFGSAATASALSGLNQTQVRWALSYAAQQASGLTCWRRDRDHIEKAFDFGGMPARNGVAAATMVAVRFHRGRRRAFRSAQFLHGVQQRSPARDSDRRPRKPLRDPQHQHQEMDNRHAVPGGSGLAASSGPGIGNHSGQRAEDPGPHVESGSRHGQQSRHAGYMPAASHVSAAA